MEGEIGGLMMKFYMMEFFGDDDDVVMDDGGDAPPVPKDSAGHADPSDPLQEQSHPEPGSDGLIEALMRKAFDVWQRWVKDATMWV